VVGRLGAAIEQRLAELGYQNGGNIDIVTRIAVPRPEIVEKTIAVLRPDIDMLVVGGTLGGAVARKLHHYQTFPQYSTRSARQWTWDLCKVWRTQAEI
jgi:nucleotide-binding universal stress UspA family protein